MLARILLYKHLYQLQENTYMLFLKIQTQHENNEYSTLKNNEHLVAVVGAVSDDRFFIVFWGWGY